MKQLWTGSLSGWVNNACGVQSYIIGTASDLQPAPRACKPNPRATFCLTLHQRVGGTLPSQKGGASVFPPAPLSPLYIFSGHFPETKGTILLEWVPGQEKHLVKNSFLLPSPSLSWGPYSVRHSSKIKSHSKRFHISMKNLSLNVCNISVLRIWPLCAPQYHGQPLT